MIEPPPERMHGAAARRRQNVDKADLALQMAQVKLDSAQHDYNTKVTWTPNGNQLNSAAAGLANAQAAVQRSAGRKSVLPCGRMPVQG